MHFSRSCENAYQNSLPLIGFHGGRELVLCFGSLGPGGNPLSEGDKVDLYRQTFASHRLDMYRVLCYQVAKRRYLKSGYPTNVPGNKADFVAAKYSLRTPIV